MAKKKKPAKKPAVKKAPKPRNPKAQDATLINIDALKKRLDLQKMRISVRDGIIEKLDKRVRAAEDRIGNLELKVNELLPLRQKFREMQSDIDAIALHAGLELGMSGGGSSEAPATPSEDRKLVGDMSASERDDFEREIEARRDNEA